MESAGQRPCTSHEAKKEVFRKNYSTLRSELSELVDTLNSKLYSVALISLDTLQKKDIGDTLTAVVNHLECEESAFKEFISVLESLPSKKHLARKLSDELSQMLREETVQVLAIATPSLEFLSDDSRNNTALVAPLQV